MASTTRLAVDHIEVAMLCLQYRFWAIASGPSLLPKSDFLCLHKRLPSSESPFSSLLPRPTASCPNFSSTARPAHLSSLLGSLGSKCEWGEFTQNRFRLQGLASAIASRIAPGQKRRLQPQKRAISRAIPFIESWLLVLLAKRRETFSTTCLGDPPRAWLGESPKHTSLGNRF